MNLQASSILAGLLAASVILPVGCGGSSPTTPGQVGTNTPPPASPAPAPTPPPTSGPRLWDLEADGVPRFITHDYIDLAPIVRISRFRSGEGHSYADDVESCRSMKHYYAPPLSTPPGTIAIYSPVRGRVLRVLQEWAGVQIEIQATDAQSFSVILFHVTPTIPIAEGTQLDAGQRIGTHVGPETMSDVAVRVSSTRGMRLVSYIEALTDTVFERYQARGVLSRDAAIITQTERDESPLSCNGETFADRGTLENWVTLR